MLSQGLTESGPSLFAKKNSIKVDVKRRFQVVVIKTPLGQNSWGIDPAWVLVLYVLWLNVINETDIRKFQLASLSLFKVL